MPRPKKDTQILRPPWAASLAARRLQLGLSQEAVAGRTGDLVAQRTVSHLESGKTFIGDLSLTRAAALARALDWSLFELQDATGVDLGLGRNPASTLVPAAIRAVELYPMAAVQNPVLPAHPTSVMLAPRQDGQSHPEQLRAYIMDSDEMTVPGQRSIHPGDYVVTDINDQQLVHGGLYVISRNARAHVRRFKDTEMGRGFYADNVSYDPFPVIGTRVVGRVYRLWSDRAPTLI